MEKSFVEQVRELNLKYGKNLSFEELKELKEEGELKTELTDMDNIDGIVFVHITNWAPADNMIKTAKEKKVVQSFLGYEIENPRDTTHFTRNGVVTTHGGETGDSNWDKRKFAIIIPGRTFIENNGAKLLGANPEDSFLDGSADITDAIISCSQKYSEKMQMENPNAVVIPASGDLVVDTENDINFAEDLLRLMGYTVYKIASHGYETNETLKDSDKRSQSYKVVQDEIMKKYGKKILAAKHSDSLPKSEEYLQICAQITNKQLEQIPNEELQIGEIDNISKNINGTGIKSFYIFYDKNSSFAHYDVDRIKKSVNMINTRLIPIGLSELDTEKGEFFDVVNKDSYANKRSVESRIIDSYLGQSITDLYDGDIITTNLKRIILISDKMKAEGTLDNKNSGIILRWAVKHFLSDLMTLSMWHDERIDMQDFDIEKYMSSLKAKFTELGISGDELLDMATGRVDKNDKFANDKLLSKLTSSLTEKIIKEKKIESFIEEQGYIEDSSKDIALRAADRIQIVEQVMRSVYAEFIRAGKTYDDIYDDMGGISDDIMIEFGDSIEKLSMAESVLFYSEDTLDQEISTRENAEDILLMLQERRLAIGEDEDEHIFRIWQQAKNAVENEKKVAEPMSSVKNVLYGAYNQAQICGADITTAHGMLRQDAQIDRGDGLTQNSEGGVEFSE